MENKKDRLNYLINKLGLSKNQFGKNTGISSAVVSKITTKDINFGVDVLEKIISTYPRLNSVWILNGIGEMWNDDHHETHTMSHHEVKIPKEDETGIDNKTSNYINLINRLDGNKNEVIELIFREFSNMTDYQGSTKGDISFYSLHYKEMSQAMIEIEDSIWNILYKSYNEAIESHKLTKHQAVKEVSKKLLRYEVIIRIINNIEFIVPLFVDTIYKEYPEFKEIIEKYSFMFLYQKESRKLSAEDLEELGKDSLKIFRELKQTAGNQ